MDELFELIDQVKHLPAIVEGKRDVISLEKLGFTNIIQLDKPAYQIAESIEEETVQILTDLDKEGRGLYQRLRTELTRNGIKIDNRLREMLFQTELTHIEGLFRYLQRISSSKNS